MGKADNIYISQIVPFAFQRAESKVIKTLVAFSAFKLQLKDNKTRGVRPFCSTCGAASSPVRVWQVCACVLVGPLPRQVLLKPESVCKQSVLSQKCPRDLLQEVKLLKSPSFGTIRWKHAWVIIIALGLTSFTNLEAYLSNNNCRRYKFNLLFVSESD